MAGVWDGSAQQNIQKRGKVRMKCWGEFDFIHFWSVTLVNTIKTTSFTPPSVIKLHCNKCNLITLGGVNEVVLIAGQNI
jgi:hypothetical protein